MLPHSALAIAAMSVATGVWTTSVWTTGAMAQDGGDAAQRVQGRAVPTQPVAPQKPLTAGRPGADDPARPDGPGDDDRQGLIPRSDPTSDPRDPSDPNAEMTRLGERPVPRDGEIETPEDGAGLRDGILEETEPLPPEDGGDGMSVDTRPREEFELFETVENPPAGFDPLLFQIEDIDPLRTDRRPGRLFTREPYDPVGIRIGSFVYFPEIEGNLFATSNVRRQTPASEDVAFELLSTSRLVSNWARHALEVTATSDLSFYDQFTDEDERSWSVEGRGRIDLARRTNIQALASHSERQEGRSAIDANQTGDRAQVAEDKAAATLNQRFNRLSVQLRGAFEERDYGPVEGIGGVGGQTNDDRDTREFSEVVRATWEFKPTLSAFAEVETNQRRYNVAAVVDQLRRDSDGQRYRAGLDFGSTGAILRGEVSVGYGRQDPEEASLSAVEGILVDANLVWRVSDPTTLRLSAQTEIYDTNTLGSAGVLTHQVGLEARHQFRRYLIGTAGITYTSYDYDNIDISESEIRSLVGVEYFLNREWTLFGRYEHTEFVSNQLNGDWRADDLRVGARWRR
ncbi:MAG: outer membrane beta-barrel protein [Hyphomicrobium sp.]|nr:outer membrane beta-barrel protein [Hyphomicrobium sp.]